MSKTGMAISNQVVRRTVIKGAKPSGACGREGNNGIDARIPQIAVDVLRARQGHGRVGAKGMSHMADSAEIDRS